jgi:ubiquinone biosynthesis monooxygenase Coq7
MQRHYTLLDQLCMNLDNAVRTVFGRPPSNRDNPAADLQETELTDAQRRHAAGLMRVNHSGEVCAQALYQGQALTARDKRVAQRMAQASEEENDHLAWCEQRLNELGSHTSFLNPLWYTGSFMIGALAGAAGDKWSLGFVAETERQVVKHLQRHLQWLPESDHKSRTIVEQMKVDEGKHATMAVESGAAELPQAIKNGMTLTSKVMTSTVYFV